MNLTPMGPDSLKAHMRFGLPTRCVHTASAQLDAVCDAMTLLCYEADLPGVTVMLIVSVV